MAWPGQVRQSRRPMQRAKSRPARMEWHHDGIERPLRRLLLDLKMPRRRTTTLLAAPAHRLDPGPKTHVEAGREVAGGRVHRRRAGPGIGTGGRPAGDQSQRFPSLHLRQEGPIAGREILRAVIEACLAGRGVQPPGRHPAAGSAPLVEQRHRMVVSPQFIGTSQPGNPGTDDRNPHDVSPATCPERRRRPYDTDAQALDLVRWWLPALPARDRAHA